MDLIDHDPAQAAEQFSGRRLAEEDGEALRRGEQDIRRLQPQLLADAGGGVSGAQADAERITGPGQERAEAAQMGTEILAGVVGEGLQGSNVQTTAAGGDRLLQELIEDR